MSEADRTRWDEKYAGREVSDTLQPHPWLVENAASLQPGRAVDLATGLGHNAVWLAQQGFDAAGWDVSPVGLKLAATLAEKFGVRVDWQTQDLDEAELPADTFDLIVCTTFYLPAHIRPQIAPALRPGGHFLYEAFCHDELDRPHSHCRNPQYMLAPNEPLSWLGNLRLRRYLDGVCSGRAVIRLLAEKPADKLMRDEGSKRLQTR